MVDLAAIKKGGADDTDDAYDTGIGTTFSAETNKRDEDAEMWADDRRGRAVDDQLGLAADDQLGRAADDQLGRGGFLRSFLRLLAPLWETLAWSQHCGPLAVRPAGLREDKAPVITGARSTAAWPLGDIWCHVMTSKVAVFAPDRRRSSDDKGSISRRH